MMPRWVQCINNARAVASADIKDKVHKNEKVNNDIDSNNDCELMA